MAPPTAFKPIQPAPAKRERSGDGPGGTRSMSGSVLSDIITDRPTKRLKAVTQACHTCRKFKARVSDTEPLICTQKTDCCDGARPRCGGCAAKGKPCGYEGEEGQSRQAAMKSRLEALEKLMGALQSKSPEEAEELLQRIRSADDILSLSSISAESPSAGAPSVVSRASSASQRSGTPLKLERPSPTRLSSNVSESSDPSSASSASSGSTTLVTPTSSLSSPLRTPNDASPYLIGFLLPSAQSTWAGVQSFYSSSGKLFQVFSEAQVREHHKNVYGLDGKPNKSQKVSICCLCIVAAIGVQYNPGDFEKGADEALYEVAHHLFGAVVEASPLEAIKVCTLLAMYNVMNKATAALAFVETGLSMSKRQSLNTGVCHPSHLSDEEWKDFRQTWRTLIFFSSWLSSTLGYISGNGDSTSAFEKLVPLADPDYDNYNEVAEMVQAEMTKIALLKAGILKTHLANKELTVYGMNGIIKELQEWHQRLPPEMQLAKIGQFDIAPGIRWSIYHIHLLYLGAYMLVYRRIAAQCVREYREGEKFVLTNDDSTLLSLVDQGVTAARDSARILGLLHADRGIFRRCWLVIFQAHTSCVVILHSVAQKQLHNFPASSWTEEMNQARNCVEVLGFCAEQDPVARRFFIKLSGIYEALVETGSSKKTNHQRIEEWVPLPPGLSRDQAAAVKAMSESRPSSPKAVADYLLTIPPDADPELTKRSITLLQALCKPWGEGEIAVEHAELAVCDQMGGGKASSANAGFVCQVPSKKDGVDQLSTRTLPKLDWEIENHNPFRWDTTGLPAQNMEEAWFLGSEAPNGWSPAVDIEEAEGDY
ncbi:hypothetical protein QBC38DRAFT_423353 [Podospora fimiseda]|uniref:Zn(2)-C6 fungal-type domain-containing protein n=1 Tax=Podospora fimiseda TaxID=252190 RepID=A0AAN7GQC4_9PEZI|nr:hypothetical protein QBC38DRAFT_423353 [Podospora fimiseda]